MCQKIEHSNTDFFIHLHEILFIRTKTSFLNLSTVDRLQDLNIGYHLPRRYRSSCGINNKEQNTHSFIVALFNAHLVKSNYMARNPSEITCIKDNSINVLFVTETWLSAHSKESKTVE